MYGVRQAVRVARPYGFHLFLLAYMAGLLLLDMLTHSLLMQSIIGLITFGVLAFALRASSPLERRQVWLLVLLATLVELDCSVLWGVYRYRLHNIPLFVPPGHGLIYLFALTWGRTPLMQSHGRLFARLASGVAIGWALLGVTVSVWLAHRPDLLGLILLPIFLWILRTPSGATYVGAFAVTSLLELMGTGLGSWTWAASAPVLHVPIGNPPSVIAGAYCVIELGALKLSRLNRSTGREWIGHEERLPARALGWAGAHSRRYLTV